MIAVYTAGTCAGDDGEAPRPVGGTLSYGNYMTLHLMMPSPRGTITCISRFEERC